MIEGNGFLSVFFDKSRPPDDEDLKIVLGNTFTCWNELKKLMAERFPPLSFEWGFTSKNTGWGLRLKRGERTILYMAPRAGYFMASFALGEKAVKMAHASGLPKPILAAIDGARKYAEGRGLRLEVKSVETVAEVVKIAAIKVAN